MANDDKRQRRQLVAQIIAKAWTEPNFKARLLSDPAAVLAEYGMPLAPGRTFMMHEDTTTVEHGVLPLPPQGLAPQQLADPRNVDTEYCYCDYHDKHLR